MQPQSHMILNPGTLQLIDIAVMEDCAMGDATTETLISTNTIGDATIVSDEIGILAGIPIALEVFKRIDPSLTVKSILADGDSVKTGSEVATISGSLASILTAERTALNFIRKLSGIATQTSKFVEQVSGTNAKIVDTRKTTPGFRYLEKYAVRMGGGNNHRHNLADGILIKDNHLRALAKDGLSMEDVVRKAYKLSSHTIKVEVEVENIAQVESALHAGAEILLLDNMSNEDMETVVKMCQGKAVTEASGGISLARVLNIANTGVDIISIGALTHSAPSLDLSLDIT